MTQYKTRDGRVIELTDTEYLEYPKNIHLIKIENVDSVSRDQDMRKKQDGKLTRKRR